MATCPCRPTDLNTRKALEEEYAWLIDALERYALQDQLEQLVMHLYQVLRTLHDGAQRA
jgi:hypothetical protein